MIDRTPTTGVDSARVLLKKYRPGDWVRVLLPYRWLAAILLVIAVDVCTFLALARAGANPIDFSHQDKLLHALGFFILALLGHLVLFYDLFPKVQRHRTFLLLINAITWLIYGIGIELAQSLTSYRQASVGDVAADAVGIVLALIVATSLKLYPRRNEEA